MKMRKFLFITVVALLATMAIVQWTKTVPYAEKLIRLQAEQSLGKIDKRILDEPLAVQALLLDYAGDGGPESKGVRSELVLKAWVALAKYPLQSREVLQIYGSKPEFQSIIREHGEFVIPVIKYFLDNDLLSLRIQAKVADAVIVATETVSDAVNTATKQVGGAVTAVKQGAKHLWDKVRGISPVPASVPAQTPAPAPPPTAQPVKAEFGPTERGWYAINSIKNDGHKFLGQFALDATNVAHWNQTNRVVTTVGTCLTGGLSNLERKYELDEKIGGSDVFFAAIDVIPFVAAVKLLKAGKVVAATGKELSLVSKTRLFAARLIPKSPLLKAMGKYGVMLATGYVVLTHPALLNSVFAELAELLGLNPVLVQFLGWFLLITVALYPFSWLLKSMARIVIVGFSWLERSKKQSLVSVGPSGPKAI